MSFAKEIRDLMGRCSRLEQQVAKLPTRIGSSAGGARSVGAVWYTAPSKAELPDPETVDVTSMARVTDGDQKGAVYVVSPDGTNWDAINFLEIAELPS